MVGLFAIAVGVGPHTGPDVAYHLGILAVLVWVWSSLREHRRRFQATRVIRSPDSPSR